MAGESREQLRNRATAIVKKLRKQYPDARTELVFSTPLEMLVATILSAQATDVGVNKVTPALFAKYKTAADWADAPQEVLEQEIRSTGFYRNKAKSIRLAAAMLVEKFGGRVPDDMDRLLELPGVARKTANVVLGSAFGKAQGIAVDRHVARVSGRMKLTKNVDPVKIEQDLMVLVPRKDWINFSHAMVLHGRRICTARKPKCEICPVKGLCPSAFKV